MGGIDDEKNAVENEYKYKNYTKKWIYIDKRNIFTVNTKLFWWESFFCLVCLDATKRVHISYAINSNRKKWCWPLWDKIWVLLERVYYIFVIIIFE